MEVNQKDAQDSPRCQGLVYLLNQTIASPYILSSTLLYYLGLNMVFAFPKWVLEKDHNKLFFKEHSPDNQSPTWE